MKGPGNTARRLVLLCLLPIGGCSGFQSSAPPVQTYYLHARAATPADPAAVAPRPRSVSVRVAHPIADPGLDSAHIVLVRTDQRLDFFAASAWAAPAPELIASLTVQTLERSGAFASVRDARSPFPAEYLLQVVVRRFEADYTSGAAAPEVQVLLDCTLGTTEGREVIATFMASGSAAATANHMSDVVAAFQQATGTALAALSRETVAALEAASARTAEQSASPAPGATSSNR